MAHADTLVRAAGSVGRCNAGATVLRPLSFDRAQWLHHFWGADRRTPLSCVLRNGLVALSSRLLRSKAVGICGIFVALLLVGVSFFAIAKSA
jgi:hypothetical protein